MTVEKKWSILDADKSLINNLSTSLNVSDIIAKLLVLRGVHTFEEAKLFFRPELEHLHDPFLMKDMSKAVQRIEKAIANNENILIYGDYDVDGTTSVAMVYQFLYKRTKNIRYYIPCRYTEGYGVSFKAIEYAYENNVSLIIALDCGIRAVSQINYANKKKIDFIICDHHTPGEHLPEAIAILNPKQKKCNYPFSDLSACGVGFKLIHAFSVKNEISFSEVIKYLDLVVISISADIVPMNGENRVLSFYGLKQINTKPSSGIKALIGLTNKKNELNVSDILFGIAPRINAAGRIDHATKAVEVLIEQDYIKAKQLAKLIDLNNIKRKELEAETTREAIEMLDKTKNTNVVFHSNWHKGVIGIVASRLIESHYRPTIVFAEKDGLLTGSARSINDFNLYESLLKCSYLFEKFGGHKYAAGLTLKKENLEQFIIEFEKIVSEKITLEQLQPNIAIDMEINIDEIDYKLFRIIDQLSPFGPTNKRPIFLSKGVSDSGFAKQVGDMKNHLKLNIKKSEKVIPAIGFNMGRHLQSISRFNDFDICYSIDQNEWNGRKELQIQILDLKINS